MPLIFQTYTTPVLVYHPPSTIVGASFNFCSLSVVKGCHTSLHTTVLKSHEHITLLCALCLVLTRVILLFIHPLLFLVTPLRPLCLDSEQKLVLFSCLLPYPCSLSRSDCVSPVVLKLITLSPVFLIPGTLALYLIVGEWRSCYFFCPSIELYTSVLVIFRPSIELYNNSIVQWRRASQNCNSTVS